METAGPFRVPGESRTRWVNLRDAESEIPALRAMLESAQRGDFDVLIVWDYNRLRDLLDSIAKTLSHYGVQIYSVNQPVDPVPPEQYNPYAVDSESMMRGMAQIMSRAQIADLQRKKRFGVLARVQRGLYGHAVPYGYIRSSGGKQSPPEINPLQAQAVTLMKDLFLSGASTRMILVALQDKYPTPRGVEKWSRAAMATILQNPFYTGKVFFQRTKTHRDPYYNTVKIERKSTPEVIVDGKHKALYSWDEYLAILAEFERRGSLPVCARYTYSGLLTCSVCGRRLRHRQEKKRDGAYRWDGWRCWYTGDDPADHIGLTMREAHEIIPPAVQKAVREVTDRASVEFHIQAQAPSNNNVIADLERQRKRVQSAYESGIYTVQEAEERIKDIERKIVELKDHNAQHQRREAEYRQWLNSTQEIAQDIEDLPEWTREHTPREVNNILLMLCKEIVISPDRTVTVKLRF